MHATRIRPPVEVSADGSAVVSHAGSRLLTGLAEPNTLTGAAVGGVRAPQVAADAHDPGLVLTDLAM